MKRKIAVIGNGWNNLNLTQAIKGIRSCTDKLNIDVFLFLSYAAFSQSVSRNEGENSILKLINYTDYDGVIVFANMLDSQQTVDNIGKILLENKVNAVSVGGKIEGIDYVGIENTKGMYDMVAHLVDEHHIKNPVFFAGTKTHIDSNERLEATRCALNDRGISLPDEKVWYTDWEYIKSMNLAQELSKSDNPPDAYICANDNIALATCIGLDRENVKVPGDAIVTGFDRLSYADTFYPSITTVYQNYEKIGYMAIWHLLEKIEGNAKETNIRVSAEYIKNESCGCKKSNDAELVRHKFCQDAYAHEMENIIFQIHTTNIAQVLFEHPVFKQCKEYMGYLLKSAHIYEGENFYIIIDDAAMKSFNDSSFNLKKEYSKMMQCFVALENGVIKDYKPFKKEKLLPNFIDSNTGNLYIITSLHFDDNLFGYMVMENKEDHIADTTLNHYLMQMNSNLEKYRQNCRLEQMNSALKELSVRDQLTYLYNRFGMEQKAIPLFEKLKNQKKSCSIIFSDINKMKYINDNFGHLHGDLAIKTVSASLIAEIPSDWIAIRYGGDEFVAIGECESEEVVKEYIEKIKKNLEEHVKTMCLAYPLTASIGYLITEPESKLTLTQYINKADTIMYKNKHGKSSDKTE